MFYQFLHTQRVCFAIDVSSDRFQPISSGNKFVSAPGRARQVNQFAKRFIDIVLSSIGLVALLPLFAIIVVAVKIQDPGPAIFRQKRWGKGGKILTVFKFRTMYLTMCDNSGAKQTTEYDNRVTRIGQFLRRSNFDELPQLINVLLGDMSLVGPRCHPIKMYAGVMVYEELVPSYHRRHAVKPGITGLAQINKLRGPTFCPERARMRIVHDRLYVIKNNIWLDMKIITLTVLQEVRGGYGF